MLTKNEENRTIIVTALVKQAIGPCLAAGMAPKSIVKLCREVHDETLDQLTLEFSK